MSEPGESAAAAVNQEPDILDDVNRAIARLEAHADPDVPAQLQTILQGIDDVHRTGLTRLMNSIRSMAGDAFVNRLLADHAVRLLLMSYELVPVDRRLQAEEALDTVRGHLHARSIDVEIFEVVGGVIYARLHGVKPGDPVEEAAVRDVESALKESFIGFQELVLGPRDSGKRAASQFVPLSSLGRARRPTYHRAMAESDLTPGTLRAVTILEESVLLARVGEQVYAVQNRCGESPLPLEFSSITGSEIRCSWHGCRYDVRSGQRVDGDFERLRVYPVRVDKGDISIAVGTAGAVS
ncbi:MAG: Rieske (2Fe-2S) protein [Vicinamibacteria bacterium]